MTTPTTTRPATDADFERILAEMRRLLRRASPATRAQVRAAVRDLQAKDAEQNTAQTGNFEART